MATVFTSLLALTSRFRFQLMDDEHPCTPDMFNAVANAVDSNMALAPLALTNFVGGTGVVASSNVPRSLQRLRLTLTNAVVPLTNALKYGSLSIMTWPNTNILLVNSRESLTVVKDGVGTTAASTPAIAVGSVAASASTLVTTMIDTIDLVTLAGTLSAVAQKNGPNLTQTPNWRRIAAGASNQLFLNGSNAGSGSGADGTLTVSGTIDLDFFDLGLFSSSLT